MVDRCRGVRGGLCRRRQFLLGGSWLGVWGGTVVDVDCGAAFGEELDCLHGSSSMNEENLSIKHRGLSHHLLYFGSRILCLRVYEMSPEADWMTVTIGLTAELDVRCRSYAVLATRLQVPKTDKCCTIGRDHNSDSIRQDIKSIVTNHKNSSDICFLAAPFCIGFVCDPASDFLLLFILTSCFYQLEFR